MSIALSALIVLGHRIHHSVLSAKHVCFQMWSPCLLMVPAHNVSLVLLGRVQVKTERRVSTVRAEHTQRPANVRHAQRRMWSTLHIKRAPLVRQAKNRMWSAHCVSRVKVHRIHHSVLSVRHVYRRM